MLARTTRSSGPTMIIASRVVSTVVRHSDVMVESRSREMLRAVAVRLRCLAPFDAFAARRFVVFGMLLPRERVNGDVVYYSRGGP